MSTSEQDSTILGKRIRGSNELLDKDITETIAPVEGNEAEDDEDDDVGPMPMPVDAAANGGVKKKRKGV